MSKGPVSQFIQHHYRHFNAATLVDAADGYVKLLDEGGRMFLAMAGAMSTAELGISLAEMIRQVASPPKKRRPTRPTRGSKERRLKNKKQRSQRKELRRRPGDGE